MLRCLSKVNKATGHRLLFSSTGYLLTVYLLTRSRPSVSARMCHDQAIGKLLTNITYPAFQVQLNKLVKRGLLQSELVTYKGRQVTRYSLTISGHNYLTELERLAKAAKFTLDS